MVWGVFGVVWSVFFFFGGGGGCFWSGLWCLGVIRWTVLSRVGLNSERNRPFVKGSFFSAKLSFLPRFFYKQVSKLYFNDCRATYRCFQFSSMKFSLKKIENTERKHYIAFAKGRLLY